MTTRIFIAGRQEPFEVKGEPEAIRDELLKTGEMFEGNQTHPETEGQTWLMRYPGFVQFEAAHGREPVYVAPNHVAVVAGPA